MVRYSLLIIACCAVSIICFSQKKDKHPNPDSTYISNSGRAPVRVVFKFDSLITEVYLDGARLAIIPENMRRFVDSTRVSRTEPEIETLPDGRKLFRTMVFVSSSRKGR